MEPGSYFSQLPRELNIEAVLKLDYSEARDKCLLIGVCDDEKFWQEYVRRHYLIRAKSERLSYSQVAEMAHDILTALFAKQLYPSFRVLPFLFEHYIVDTRSVNRIMHHIDGMFGDHAFISFYSWSDLFYENRVLDRLADDMLRMLALNFPITDQETDIRSHTVSVVHQQYTPFERKFLHVCMEAVTQDTVYLTVNGQQTIPFDIDIMYSIWPDTPIPEVMHSFVEYAQGEISEYGDLVFLKYFD